MCSIQFAIMAAQTVVPVNAFGEILSRVGENNSHALLGKQGVCIYKRTKPAVSGIAGNRRFCLLGSIPNFLNSISRWLRLCEPDGFLNGVLCVFGQSVISPFFKNLAKAREEKRRNGA
jgi:hypothetical protein